MDVKDYVVVIFILVFACGAGILSAYQYVESVKKDKRDKEMTIKLSDAQEKVYLASQEIANAQTKALEVSLELKNAQKQTIIIANELIEAQKRIDGLQNETILQVVGSGYPRLIPMNEAGPNFIFFINASQNYPIYEVNIRIDDAEKLFKCNPNISKDKVVINKTCYGLCQIFSSKNAVNLSGKTLFSIDLILQKKNYYLVSQFMSKNILTVQYSIIKFENNEMKHFYRIYEVLKKDDSFLELLENSEPSIPEEEWKKHFFLKKTVIVDFAK